MFLFAISDNPKIILTLIKNIHQVQVRCGSELALWHAGKEEGRGGRGGGAPGKAQGPAASCFEGLAALLFFSFLVYC